MWQSAGYLTKMHPQDQLILIEALTYWAYDVNETGDFDRSDPRRNRAAEIVGELLRNKELPDGEFSNMIDCEWAGPQHKLENMDRSTVELID